MKNRYPARLLFIIPAFGALLLIISASLSSAQTRTPIRPPKVERESYPIRRPSGNLTISATVNKSCGRAPFSVSFSALSSNSQSTGVSYKWLFGDGGESTGAQVTYTYQVSGNFTAKVTATDAAGAKGEYSVIISVSSLAPVGTGMKYYVSPSGSNNNPGTESLPFKTIQQAADIVNPGDTVIVEDGVYTMGAPNSYCDSDTAVVCLTRGGDANNLVTFKSRNKWGAKINGENNRVHNGFRFASDDANYIRVEGFEVYGMGNNGSSSGFELYNGGHDTQIVGNRIHHIGRLCTDTDNGMVGVYVKQSKVLIEGNVIHDVGRLAPGEGGCNPAKPYWQNHDHGVYISRGDDVTIRNNVFYNFQRGWAIHAYPSATTRTIIAHNTFSGPNPNRDGHIIISRGGMTNSKIVNNIFHEPNTAAIYVDTSNFNNVQVSNNITSADSMANRTPPSGFMVSGNQLSTDPALINVAVTDFRLQSSSPAIDRGMNLPEVTSDSEGCLRPQGGGYDIGSHEFVGSPSQTGRLSPRKTNRHASKSKPAPPSQLNASRTARH